MQGALGWGVVLFQEPHHRGPLHSLERESTVWESTVRERTVHSSHPPWGREAPHTSLGPLPSLRVGAPLAGLTSLSGWLGARPGWLA